MIEPPLVRILVGSETGYTREVGKQIALDLLNYRIITKCNCSFMPQLRVELHFCDDFFLRENNRDSAESKHDFLLFVVCTTGDGECPSTMSQMWKKLLNKNIETFSLINLGKKKYFSVFGIGDSGYEKFNIIAKMLYNRMLHLGGEPIAYRGLGDENDVNAISASHFETISNSPGGHGLQEACPDQKIQRCGVYVELFPWLHEVRRAIANILKGEEYSATLGLEKGFEHLPWTRCVSFAKIEDKKRHEEKNKTLSSAYVKMNRRITSSDHFQDVRHVDIVVQNMYQKHGELIEKPYPGSLFGFSPPNSLLNITRIVKYISFPTEALKSSYINFKALQCHSASPCEELLKICSSESMPIIQRELEEHPFTTEQIFELIYLGMVSLKIEALKTSAHLDHSEQYASVHSTEDELTFCNHGTLFESIPSAEADFSKKWISVLDLLLFGLDLEKPPRLCFLRQVLYWFVKQSKHAVQRKYKTVPEYILDSRTDLKEIGCSKKGSQLSIDVEEKLGEFISCDNSLEYDNYFIREHRNMADFFEDFDTVMQEESLSSPLVIPIEEFANYCPFILPRLYSLSSHFSSYSETPKDSHMDPTNHISITVGIVEFRTVHGRACIGHASRYLRPSLRTCRPCFLPRPFFRPGKVDPRFSYSKDPIIFCATGIGIGACRSIYVSRECYFSREKCQQEQREQSRNSADILLYGCRYSQKDFLYKSDFEKYFPACVQRGNFPTVAFSREHSGFKVYVQNLLYDETLSISEEKEGPLYSDFSSISLGRYVAHLLTTKNASFFVCGSSKNLPREVREALISVLTEHGHGIENETHARDFLAILTRKKKLVMDTW